MSGLVEAGAGKLACLIAEAASPGAHGFWQRLVTVRGAVLRALLAMPPLIGWAVCAALFMAAVLAMVRSGNRSGPA